MLTVRRRLQVLAVRGSGGGDLHREFAGRRQNQHGRTGNRLRAARAGAVSRTRLTRLAGLRLLQLRETLDGGQHERGGLARTGRARDHQIAAGDASGNRALLNRGRVLIASGGQRGDDIRRTGRATRTTGRSVRRLQRRRLPARQQRLRLARVLRRCCETEGLVGDGVQRAAGVLLEVMRILETILGMHGINTSAPIGIPKSSDSASKEAASKSKNGGSSRQ